MQVPVSLPTQPGSRLLQALFGFERLPDVKVGATQTATFSISADTLKIADLATGDLVSAPGTYTLRFDAGSGGAKGTRAEVALAVGGPQVVIEPFPKKD